LCETRLLVSRAQALRLSLLETEPSASVGNRRIEARSAVRVAMAARERLVGFCLNRGLSTAEVATRIGVT